MRKSLIAITAVAIFAVGSPQFAAAESDSEVAASPTAAARVDFKVTIPSFLYFKVGAAGATIDAIEFDLSSEDPEQFGNGTDTYSGTGGSATGGAVDVRIISNGGQVQIEESNAGGAGLANTATDEIPFSEIGTTASNTDLPAPTLSDSDNNTSTPTLNSGKVTDRTGVWTYEFLNTDVYEAGVYGGVNTNNSRVTYTASIP